LAVAAHIPPNCEAADALHSSVKSRHLIGAGFLRSDRSHRPFVPAKRAPSNDGNRLSRRFAGQNGHLLFSHIFDARKKWRSRVGATLVT
jgi:hypothetical protein